jgi:hypothetical protein
MRSRLDQIELRLQSFIESSLYFLPGGQKQAALAHQLAAAIERSVIQETNGIFVSPDQFKVRLNPANLSVWALNPGLTDSLLRVLIDSAREAGVEFAYPPILELQADASLPLDSFEIETFTREDQVEHTAAFMVQEERQAFDPRPDQAFLIINGNTILLSHPVINIGRREDNQIVVDDPRVSRTHAQLRAVKGHYILFDLNSTGGSYVNGVRVAHQSLNPGDVISLAGYPLIYGEENVSSQRGHNDFTTGRLETRPDHPNH